MTTPTDLRWQQRLASYHKARQRLASAVQLAATRPLSDLEKKASSKPLNLSLNRPSR